MRRSILLQFSREQIHETCLPTWAVTLPPRKAAEDASAAKEPQESNEANKREDRGRNKQSREEAGAALGGGALEIESLVSILCFTLDVGGEDLHQCRGWSDCRW